MTAVELLKAVNRVPFRPFELVTGDGERVLVPTADHFSLSPSGRLATVWCDDDSHEILDVFLITKISHPLRRPRRKSPSR